MKLVEMSDERKQTLRDGLYELQGDPLRRPALLERLPLDRMKAPDRALPEAVITIDTLRERLASPDGFVELRFPRSRVLLFEKEHEIAVGSFGYVSGGQKTVQHFTEGGAEPLASGLIAVEELERRLGREFEPRLVIVADLLLHFLVLIPGPGPGQVRFLPLAPSFGRFDPGGEPMDRDAFRRLVETLLEDRE